MSSTSPPEPQTTLTGEHALLLGAATSRANAVLADADQDRWPTDALAQFLDYLHLEVLRQVVDEEWLLFRNSRHDPQQLSNLRADHQGLRRLIDDLGEAATDVAERSPRRLAQATRELLAKLLSHIDAEEQALGGESVDPPSMSALGSTRTAGMRSSQVTSSTFTPCPARRGQTQPWDGCCAYAPANGWNCMPAPTRTPSGGDCPWLTQVATASPISRPGRRSGEFNSSDGRRADVWQATPSRGRKSVQPVDQHPVSGVARPVQPDRCVDLA